MSCDSSMSKGIAFRINLRFNKNTVLQNLIFILKLANC